MTQLKNRVIKANKILQSKVGIGAIDDDAVRQCQKLMDSSDIDFAPMALALLDDLNAAIEKAKNHRTEGDDAVLIDDMIKIVMQIKGQAGMFGYSLAGLLANIVLNFLETLDELDDHVIEIMEAHSKTLSIILKNGMKGDGGEYGQELRHELEEACRRYFAKVVTEKDFTAEDDSDIFFVG